MSKLNQQDEMQVGDSSGFRLRTSVVDWQGRASGKRTRLPVAKVRRIVTSLAFKTLFSSRSTSKTVKEPEGVKTKTTGGEEPLRL